MGKIMKDNKGFWDRWAKRYDLMMSKDGRTYARIVSRMKKVPDREMTVLELSGFKVFHKWTPQEYLDFLKENGFEITGRKIFDGTLKLTYAEAVREQG